jgi:SAM-dependent MidA family methyltransferase
MCHYRQHSHADPLWLPGLNDITAHVDFSACATAAGTAGFTVAGYTTQAHFLINCGMLELLAGNTSPTLLSGAQTLLLESEMGELFKVLALSKGLAETPLVGFERGDRRHRL